MAAGLAEPFAAFLLEDAKFGTAGFPVHDAEDSRVGDKGRPREDLARVLFDKQHLVEVELGPVLASGASP